MIMEQVAQNWGKASLSCVLLHYSFWINYFINNGKTNKKIEREVSSIMIAYAITSCKEGLTLIIGNGHSK